MKDVSCACPSCGTGLESVVGWARLVTDEPVVLAYQGRWGLRESWPVGGAEEVSVTCPRCGIPSTVGRHHPVACA